MTAPLSRAELLRLRERSATTNLATLGLALGLSEPTIRERARRGEIEALGIRVLRLGHKYIVPVADIIRFLAIDPETEAAGPVPPGPTETDTAARPRPRETTISDANPAA